MEKLIRKVYGSVRVPNDYRMQLLSELAGLGGDDMVAKKESIWTRPGFWAILAAIIIIAVIVYGFWLPGNIDL